MSSEERAHRRLDKLEDTVDRLTNALALSIAQTSAVLHRGFWGRLRWLVTGR